MNLEKILKNKNISKYKLSKISKVPFATISDLCLGKTEILNCKAETIYRICKALDIDMASFIEDEIAKQERLKSYEYGLPNYLQHDLDMYKEGLKNHSTLLDCYWGELYGSINMAEISDGIISHEHAEYLRNKYLWR